MNVHSPRHSVPEMALPFSKKTTSHTDAIARKAKTFLETTEKSQLSSDLEILGVNLLADQKSMKDISVREIETQINPELEITGNIHPLPLNSAQRADRHLPSGVLNVCTGNYLKMTLVNENGNKTGSQHMLRKETLIPQSITHQTTQIKQCCIKVASIDEARDVAKSLMTSAYIDLESASLWVSGVRDPPVTCPDGVGNAASEEPQFRVTTNFEDHEDAIFLPREEEIVPENAGSEVDEIASPKLKHCRRVTASPGEINLLTPSMDPNSENGKAPEPPVNVRKIDFEPMICIPLTESESVQKVDHQDTGTDCQSFCVQIKKPKITQDVTLKVKSDIGEDFNDLEIKKNNPTEKWNHSSPIDLGGVEEIEKKDISPAESFDDSSSTHEIIEDITPGYLVQNVMDKDVTECDTDREMTLLDNKGLTDSDIYMLRDHDRLTDCANNEVPVAVIVAQENASERDGRSTAADIIARFHATSCVAVTTDEEQGKRSQCGENSGISFCRQTERRCSVHGKIAEMVKGIDKVEEETFARGHANPEINELPTESINETPNYTQKVADYLANADSSSRDCDDHSRASESVHSSLAEDTTTIMNLDGDESVRAVDSGSLEDSTSATIHNLSQEFSLREGCLAPMKSPESSVHSDESRISGVSHMTLDSLSAISVHSSVSQNCPAACPIPEGSHHSAATSVSQDSLATALPSLQNIQECSLDSTCNHRSKGRFVAHSPEKVEPVPATTQSTPDGSLWRSKTSTSASKRSPDGDAPPLCDQLDMQLNSTPTDERQRENKRLEVSKLQELYESLNAAKTHEHNRIIKTHKREARSTTDVVKKLEVAAGGKEGGVLESVRPPPMANVHKEGHSDASSFLPTPSWTVSQKQDRQPGKRQKSETTKMDLSTDSFNSLFIENALYLEDISNMEKKGAQSIPKTGVPRKLKVKKLSFHKKSNPHNERQQKRIGQRDMSINENTYAMVIWAVLSLWSVTTRPHTHTKV
ncbi:hypothetical protein Btru_006622 [Bulinus truncatus]|nr:hypothetical protein Btru_006622 [Bulinus truncatus]